MMFKTVIWATDASEAAEASLPFARELAQESGGKLVVVHCEDAEELDLQARIESQVHDLRQDGVDVVFKLAGALDGDAAHAIADVASAFNADVIVVGTRGHGPVVGVVVGSVTQQLLHLAPCPVLAVPPATRWLESWSRSRMATTA
jgi:nucleotide-binding universal stress UspA family protein